MFVRCLLFLVLLVSCSESEFREGDVLFQSMHTRQAPLHSYVSGLSKTHCGIVVRKDDGLYVLEPLEQVTLTPIDNFIRRGLMHKYWVKHSPVSDFKVLYKNYLGLPTDSVFQFDNGSYYCAELVYEIYLKQLGLKLCEPKRLKEYGPVRYTPVDSIPGIDMEQFIVTPDDIFNSPVFR